MNHDHAFAENGDGSADGTPSAAEKTEKKSVATMLVEIAEDLYSSVSATPGRPSACPAPGRG